MTKNKLKLNHDKTEFFIASSQYNHHRYPYINDIQIPIGGCLIKLSAKIKNLGVVFDKTLSMHDHVQSTIKTVNFHLRNIYRIRRFITVNSCHHLVRSLILSRLDYANSLLYGISTKDRRKLQTLQNRAARIIFKCNRMEPSAPLLKKLHWLPVESRTIFKLMLITFKCVHGLQPSYLSNFLSQYIQNRPNLRSVGKLFLTVPRTKLIAGEKAFFACAPRLWNSLPTSLRQCSTTEKFKKALKFHLFPQ